MDTKNQPKVEIAENGLSASLMLPEEFDRALLTPEFCQPLIKRADIDPDAIDQELIASCIAEAQAAEPGRFKGTIVQAIPAVHGVDAYVQWQDDSKKSLDSEDDNPDDPQPGDADDGSISHYAQSVFTVVQSGDALGKVHPEVPGTEGKDVRGKTIAARTAKPLELKHDETITINENNDLVASSDGVLIRDYKSAHISDTLEIDQSVDFSTGNIDFPGNVLVRQGIKDCFTVRTTGDIEVRGLIEAANLFAGKDLRANGGFAGREQGRAEVVGNLYAKYLDAAQTHTTGNLCVEREIINCDNTVLGNIDSPRGSLIGGVTRVSGTVELVDLGASAQPITEIHIGVLPVLDPLIEELTQLVDHLIEERGKLLDEQEMITANSGSRIAPTHQAKLDKIARKMGKLQIQLDRAEPSLERVRERADAIRKIDLKINRKLHPNALIVFNGYHYRVTSDIKGPLRITANKRGQLEYQQGEDKPRLLSAECDLRTAA